MKRQKNLFQFLLGKVRLKEKLKFQMILLIKMFQFLLGKVRQQHFRCFQILLNQIFLIFATILSKKSVDRFSEIPDFP